MAIDFAELIDESVELAGLDAASLTGRHLSSITRSIRMLLIRLDSEGANAEYRDETNEIAVPAGASVVLLPEDTIDVSMVTVRTTIPQGVASGDTILTRISRDRWLELADRTTAGFPSCFWVSKSLPQQSGFVLRTSLLPTAYGQSAFGYGTWGGLAPGSTVGIENQRRCLVLWPGLQSEALLTINRVRRTKPPSGLAGDMDADEFWLPTMSVGLAASIAQKFNVARYADLKAEFEGMLRNRVADEDMHPVQVGFKAFGFHRSRRH